MDDESGLTLPQGKTPLHLAAMKGDENKVQLLINAGADPDTKDESGELMDS